MKMYNYNVVSYRRPNWLARYGAVVLGLTILLLCGFINPQFLLKAGHNFIYIIGCAGFVAALIIFIRISIEVLKEVLKKNQDK